MRAAAGGAPGAGAGPLLLVVALLALSQGGEVLTALRGLGGGESLPDAPRVPHDALSAGGKVHISFCTSWSYGGAYLQVKRALEAHFPDLQVVGTNYPPAPLKALAARAVSTASMSAIVFTLAGDRLFPALGMAPPGFVKMLQDSKLQSCAAAWFLGNTVQQNLISTGAFEVYYDGAVVFSKLASGAAPHLAAIVRDVAALHSAAGAAAAALR